MRSKIAQKMWEETPKETKIFAAKYADLVICINRILKKKTLNNSQFAELLDKRPSEIHKWLHGGHNFTLKSICKLEAELGETLLEIPSYHKLTSFTNSGKKQFNTAYRVPHYERQILTWQNQQIKTPHKTLKKVKSYA